MTEDEKSDGKYLKPVRGNFNYLAVLTLLFGGGGMFSAYKWFDAERDLAAVNLRQKSIEIEILQNEALNKSYKEHIENLSKNLLDPSISSENKAAIELELKAINEERTRRYFEFREKIVKYRRARIGTR